MACTPVKFSLSKEMANVRFAPWLSLEGMEIQKKEDILYTRDTNKRKPAMPIGINGRGLYKFPDFPE